MPSKFVLFGLRGEKVRIGSPNLDNEGEEEGGRREEEGWRREEREGTRRE